MESTSHKYKVMVEIIIEHDNGMLVADDVEGYISEALPNALVKAGDVILITGR